MTDQFTVRLAEGGWNVKRLTRLLITLAFVMPSLLVGCAAEAGHVPALAAGSTHYVSPSGMATWAQSVDGATPCSMSTAVAAYAAGDTVIIRGGTYPGRPTFSRSGASGNAVTFQPYPGERVTFSEGFVVAGDYLTFTGGGSRLDPATLGFVITPGSTSISSGYAPAMGQVFVSGSNNTISGFHVHTCSRGAGVSLSDSNTISGNALTNFVIGRPDVADGLNIQHDGVVIGRNVSNTTISRFDISGFGGSAGITSNQMALGTGKGVLIEDGYIHGPAGWFMGNNISDGDGVRFCGPNMTMRRVVIDVWQEYDHAATGLKHSDAIMAYTGSTAAQGPDNLLVEDCRFGSMNTTHSWDGRHSLGLGVSSNNSDGRTRSYQFKNVVWMMAQPTTDPTAHGVFSYSGGAGLAVYFDNCYFKGGSPSLPARVIYKNCVINWPNNRSLEYGGGNFTGSSHNAFVGYSALPTWARSQTGSFVTSNPMLVNADFSAATRYGLDADLHPTEKSPLVNAGITATTSPVGDLDGAARTGTMDIGPYAYSGPVPDPITSFRAAPTASVSLTWTNPTSPGFSSVRILRSTTGFASSPAETNTQRVIYEGSGSAYTDHPTVSAVTYYTAFARSSSGEWSARTGVTQDPRTRIVAPSSIVASYAAPAVLRVRLIDANGGGIGRKSLVVRRSDGVVTSMTAETSRGARAGTYVASVEVVAGRRTTFTVHYAGDGFLKPAIAPVAVIPRASVATPVAPKYMSRTRRYTVTGWLKPRHAAGSSPVRVYAWRKTRAGGWKPYGYVAAKVRDSASHSKYSGKVRLKLKGTWRLRAYASADSGHAAAWSNRYDYVTVR